ncbi:M23 family metallopeptidase [Paenibacillus sp. JX-17]|uniref:M23 family metallopeptidase n=1 Tax=Paenibacillus lacisoli TaxID=3064525 RepID=A0ABT9CB91_9BACL|nr:M23 family metallopeptidase [Paenibacillus sp. JX-17]MDO7906531.1 M23 family metallopeptidase [Paenibacillus sp. JX-17]
MNEQNKNQLPNDSSKIKMGESASEASAWKKMMSKRWVYPAAYIAVAAIILTVVWVYQGSSPKTANVAPAPAKEAVPASAQSSAAQEEAQAQDSKEVVAKSENLAWPVAADAETQVVKKFYEENGTEAEHQAALVQHDDTFTPNTGVDLSRADNQSFEVKAALSGKVTRLEQHPLLGNMVEITHNDGLVTVYQSLGEVSVKEGGEVKQGDVIGTAGTNELEKDLKTHLHFEVLEDGQPVNPEGFLNPKK